MLAAGTTSRAAARTFLHNYPHCAVPYSRALPPIARSFSTSPFLSLSALCALQNPNRGRDNDLSIFGVGGGGHHGTGVPSYFQRQRLPANTIIR